MQTQLKEALAVISPLAGDGLRASILLGKVKTVRRVSNEKTGEITVKADVISGEGSTTTVKFGPTDTLPGVGFEGAFVLDNYREYMNKVSADCLGFV